MQNKEVNSNAQSLGLIRAVDPHEMCDAPVSIIVALTRRLERTAADVDSFD